MAKLVEVEVKAAISKGIKSMDDLYRKLYKKGKDAKVPATFAPAVVTLMGYDPFAPKPVKAKKERKPKAWSVKKRAIRKAVLEGAATIEALHAAVAPEVAFDAFKDAVNSAFGGYHNAFNVKTKPVAEKPAKTTPYRTGTDYQAIVEFALNGGGNGMLIGEFRKALVSNGICGDEVKAHASLNVVRNPEQFSNRGKTRCANYVKGIERNADGKLTEAALAFRKTADYGKVCIEVLSLTPTMADRFGKMPKAAAAPQEQNATTPNGDSQETATSGASPVDAPAPAEQPQAVEPQATEVPAPQDAPAPVDAPAPAEQPQAVEATGEVPA